MLNAVSNEIRACYEHADFCARKAAAEANSQIRQDYLDLEQRGLSLARSYELSERLSDFSAVHRKSDSN
jgi:hypothetical protein